MKTLWTVISTLAVANLVGILVFSGWLVQSDRINQERMLRLRAMFAETIAEESARVAADDAIKARVERDAEAAARADLPPLSSPEVLELLEDHQTIAQQRVARLEREIIDLQRALARERLELENERVTFEREVEAFERMRAEVFNAEGDEQFRRALSVYESLSAGKAQALMQALIDEGRVDQAVEYLNAMQTRTAKKIIEKFTNPELAADLLERLRIRGVEARVPEDE